MMLWDSVIITFIIALLVILVMMKVFVNYSLNRLSIMLKNFVAGKSQIPLSVYI